ncbi:hypothetical protein UVI_02053130 [Ustilaginoidea virens]|uniref:Uncharacterized protein n=1 Tax=Ustilaginoidea virens TaxID=1159556 RepID=A0A1B5L579_USTVR|nr:hypothetical protein UVI_02053130 [Ustilaginoidea virens]
MLACWLPNKRTGILIPAHLESVKRHGGPLAMLAQKKQVFQLAARRQAAQSSGCNAYSVNARARGHARHVASQGSFLCVVGDARNYAGMLAATTGQGWERDLYRRQRVAISRPIESRGGAGALLWPARAWGLQ